MESSIFISKFALTKKLFISDYNLSLQNISTTTKDILLISDTHCGQFTVHGFQDCDAYYIMAFIYYMMPK